VGVIEMSRVNLPRKVRDYLAQELGPTEGPPQEFECGYCTRCCETVGKEVMLTLPEIHRLSQHFGQTMAEIFREKLHVYGAPMLLHGKFNPIPPETVPVAIQVQMPCAFLNPDYREDRANNCTINDVKPGMCLEVPICYYDVSMFQGEGIMGMTTPLESVLDFHCIQNRFVDELDVLKAKAAGDLHEREFKYTLETLYAPRITLTKDASSQICKLVGDSMGDEWYMNESEQLKQAIRFSDPLYPLEMNLAMKIIAGKVHDVFKDKVMRKLEELQEDLGVMERIKAFNRKYFAIREGNIPSHIRFIREQIRQKKKLKRRGRVR